MKNNDNPLFQEDDFKELFSEPEKVEKVEEKLEPTEVVEGISEKEKTEYLEIFDHIMFEGLYRENIQIGKKYKATFRSRSAEEDNKIALALDRMNFSTMMAYQNQASLLTLSYTLEAFGLKDFSELDPQDRYKAISNLPSTVVVILSEELNKFDSKVMKALTYGQENF